MKSKYDTDKSDLGKKIPDGSGLVKKSDYNSKVTETENKTSTISGLAKNAALTTVENKIPNKDSLVKKQIITKKILKLKKNLRIMIMINILLLQNNLAARLFTARSKQTNVVTKTDFDDKLPQTKQNIYLLKMN